MPLVIYKPLRNYKRDIEDDTGGAHLEQMLRLWFCCVKPILKELKDSRTLDSSEPRRVCRIGIGVASSLLFHAADQYNKELDGLLGLGERCESNDSFIYSNNKGSFIRKVLCIKGYYNQQKRNFYSYCNNANDSWSQISSKGRRRDPGNSVDDPRFLQNQGV